MDKPAQNIQDAFLNNARKEKSVITIYLLSGVKLSGRIKSFDKYSLVLETNNQEQLIFKHAVSTVVTQKSSHSYGGSSSGQTHAAPHSAPAPHKICRLATNGCCLDPRESAVRRKRFQRLSHLFENSPFANYRLCTNGVVG